MTSFLIITNSEGLAVGDPIEFSGRNARILAIDDNRLEIELIPPDAHLGAEEKPRKDANGNCLSCGANRRQGPHRSTCCAEEKA